VPLLSYVVVALSTSPSPSPSVKEPDADTVSPGWWGFLSLVFLVVTVVLIGRGLAKQLRRVDFDENDPQTLARGPHDGAPAESSAAATTADDPGSSDAAPVASTADAGAEEPFAEADPSDGPTTSS
jgi:hypothetical protein